MDWRSIRLTETVKKGGCAAKLPAGELKGVLSSLPLMRPNALAVGTEWLDDACLYDLGDDRYLVQTLDFFTPILDDAFDFGAVAAANALSDVYAMGGEPKIALSILAFPSATLPTEILKPLMEGALSKIHEAGACLAGGHTIDDETLKLGFSVTGFVSKTRAWTNAGARPGDRLILTKGLGTGTIASALKTHDAQPEWVQAAVDSMKQLNRAPDLISDLDVHAATDITGFGFLGHAVQMAEASRATFVFDVGHIPAIHGARESLAAENTNRAHVTNRKYVDSRIQWGETSTIDQLLLCDAQTSGGLLLSVSNAHAEEALARLRTRFPLSALVGSVESPRSGRPPICLTL